MTTQSSRMARMLGTAIGTAILAGFVSLPALAALGGDAASVDADVAKMKGQKRATAAGGYTVSEITLPSGTLLREYVSSEGKVFAVAWSGPTPPDFRQALGTYYQTIKTTAPEGHAGHHHLTVRQNDLVVSAGGHARSWRGKAYVLSLLPPNFPVDEIK